MLPPVKTAQGQDEISSRLRRLSQRHRTVLLLVDGRRCADEVRALATQAGAPESCFDELLALGLIALPAEPLVNVPMADVPAAALIEDAGDSSLLPPSRSLHPESLLSDLLPGDSNLPEPLPEELVDLADAEQRLDEARDLLIRAVRAEAPVAGSMTLRRLRRARCVADLAALLGEVESRIVKPHRSLAAQQTLQRVRQLLAGQASPLTPAG